MQRIKNNKSVVPRKRGKKPLISKEMIDFLKKWFKSNDNIGQSFKYGYDALIKQFGKD